MSGAKITTIDAKDYTICIDRWCCWIEETKVIGKNAKHAGEKHNVRITGYQANIDDLLADFIENAKRGKGKCEVEDILKAIAEAEKEAKACIRKLNAKRKECFKSF